MLSKEFMIEMAKEHQLDGAQINEIVINNEVVFSTPNTTNLEKSEGNHVTIKENGWGTGNSFHMAYDIMLKKTRFSDTFVTMEKRTSVYRCIPFTIFNGKEDESPKKIGDNKSSCNILDINISATIITDTNKYDKYNDSISVSIPINGDTYLYIINYTDGTLPTVVISKKKLPDVTRYIFTVSEPGLYYNSYFHPHSYKQIEEKVYENLVFGSPGTKINTLNFDEEILNGNEYKNTDNILAKKDKDGNIKVYFFDKEIAEYNSDNMNDFDSLYITKYNIPDNSDDTEEIDYDSIIKKYPLLSRIIISKNNYCIYHDYYNNDGLIYISKDADNDTTIYILNDYIEVLNIGTNNIKQYGICNTAKKVIFTIASNINENNEISFITLSPNRSINNSRDAISILFNTGYGYITCNKNGTIINTNLGIDGDIDLYNIFGIPENF